MERPGWGLALAAAAVTLAALACQAPLGAGTVEPAQVETALAETLAAGEAQTESAAPAASPTPEASATPEPTPSPTITPTPAPFAELTEDTNCRTGPLRVYDLMATILRGQRVEIVGKNAQETYWYVIDPDSPGRTCWMWGRYAQVSGDTSGVPVYTPPPTPTLAYDWSGSWNVWVEDDLEPASMELSQSGDSISGTIAGGDEVLDLFGTRSEGGQVVSGEVDVTPPAEITFTWRMLETKQQFVGSFTRTYQGTPNPPEPYCGARSGYSMPEPCQWP